MSRPSGRNRSDCLRFRLSRRAESPPPGPASIADRLRNPANDRPISTLGATREPIVSAAVLYPLPVMHTTTDSFEGMTPERTSWIAPASVAPPAGSVKTPSVSASSSMACRISSSLEATPVPPVAFTVRTTWNPSAGLPMAIDFAIVDGLTGSGNSRSC